MDVLKATTDCRSDCTAPPYSPMLQSPIRALPRLCSVPRCHGDCRHIILCCYSWSRLPSSFPRGLSTFFASALYCGCWTQGQLWVLHSATVDHSGGHCGCRGRLSSSREGLPIQLGGSWTLCTGSIFIVRDAGMEFASLATNWLLLQLLVVR